MGGARWDGGREWMERYVPGISTFMPNPRAIEKKISLSLANCRRYEILRSLGKEAQVTTWEAWKYQDNQLSKHGKL